MSLFTFVLPELGIDTHNAGVMHWLIKPGDWVKVDQALLEVITDGEIIQVPSPVAGVVTKMGVQEGQHVYAGTELATFAIKQLPSKALNLHELSCSSGSLRKPNGEQAILTVHKRALEHGDVPFVIEKLEARDHMTTSSFPHRCNSYQIIWITQGAGTLSIDLDEYPIQPETLFFLGPNRVHSMKATALSGLAIVFTEDVLLFDVRKALALMLSFFHSHDQTPLLLLNHMEAERFTQIVRSAEQELQCTLPGRVEALQAYLHILLTIIRRAMLQRTEVHFSCLSPLIQTFMALVETQFCQKRQVSEYAELLSVTPGHLNDLVKQGLGKTAGEIIRERILLEAKRMLLYSESSIAEIADQLDFDDPSYFSRFFRRYIHQSPNTFRNTIRQKQQTHVALPA